MSDTATIINDLTQFGLRRVHLMRPDKFSVDDGMALMPGEASPDGMGMWIYKDELGIWHLWAVWKAREVVTLESGCGVYWWVAKGEHLRDAVDFAGALLNQKTGKVPERALVQKLPAGAPDRVVVELLNGVATAVKLEAADYVAPGFVLVV